MSHETPPGYYITGSFRDLAFTQRSYEQWVYALDLINERVSVAFGFLFERINAFKKKKKQGNSETTEQTLCSHVKDLLLVGIFAESRLQTESYKMEVAVKL